MGVVGLCWCVAAILVLPSFDARNVRLVPAETKTVTTNGVTHEISRYILVPDEQTNGPSADSVTNDKIQLQIIPTAVNNDIEKDAHESNKMYKTTSARASSGNINGKVIYDTSIKPEVRKTVKTPGLVKYHLVFGAHNDDNNQTDYKVDTKVFDKLNKIKNNDVKGSAELTKVTIKEMPNQDSKMNAIHINRHDAAGKDQVNGQLTHTVTKADSDLNDAKESSKAETEFKISSRTSKQTSGEINKSGRVKIKINNPTKITNINYADLPIKLGYTQSAGNEEDHPLLTSIGINKTFTLPGKRGRFKIIHEDDDEYEYVDVDTDLERPLLHHSVSNPAHHAVKHYNNDKYLVDDTRQTISDDVDAKNNMSYRLLKIDTNHQNGGTIPTSDKNNNDKDDVELTIEEPTTIMNTLSERAIEINKLNPRYTNVKVIKSHTDTSIHNKEVYSEGRTPNLYHDTDKLKSVTKNTNEESTIADPSVINIFAQESVAVPNLNKSMKISSDVSSSKIEPRLEQTEYLSQIQHNIEDNIPPIRNSLNVIEGSFAPNIKNKFGEGSVHEISETSELTRKKSNRDNVEPTPNTNIIKTIVSSQKYPNELNVLPLKNNIDSTYSSQTEKVKTVNTTNSKSTTVTKFENNYVNKLLTVPTVEKTTITVVKNEVPKIDHVTKYSVLENDTKLTVPEIKSFITKENMSMFDSQKLKITPLFDFNIPVLKTDEESKHNYANVSNYLGMQIKNIVNEKDNKAETVPIVEKTNMKNEGPNEINRNNFPVFENYNKITINESINNLNSQEKQSAPSIDLNIPLPKTDDSDEAGVPKLDYTNVLTKNKNRIVENENTIVETVPIVKKTVPIEQENIARTIVQNKESKLSDPNNFSVFENDNNANTNENINIFDSQKGQTVLSVDLNTSVIKTGNNNVADESKQNYANVLNYIGSKKNHKGAENEDSVETIPIEQKNNARTIVENEVPKTVDLFKFSVLENDVTINEDKNNFDSYKKQIAPSSFNFNIPVQKSNDIDATVSNYFGTINKNKVAEKEDTHMLKSVPIVEATTTEQGIRGIVEKDEPKRDDEISGLENDKKLTVPKIYSQKITTVSKNHIINGNIFGSQRKQKASSFDFDIPSSKTDNSELSAESKHNYANILHYLGTNKNNLHANEYTNSDTDSEVKNMQASSCTLPITNNVAQSKIPDNFLNSDHKITKMYHSNKNFSSKSENERSNEIVNNADAITAEPNMDNLPNAYVDFGLQTPFVNNEHDNFEPLKDHIITSNLPLQNENNLGPNKSELTDSFTNTVPKTNIITEQVQLTSDEIKRLLDEHDYYRKNIKSTNQINNFMLEPNNVDLKFRLGKPKNKPKVLPTEAEFTTIEEADKNPMHFEQFENVSEPKTMTSGGDNDNYDPEGYPYEGGDARSSRVTYREEITTNEREASENKNNHYQYVNKPYENVQTYSLPSNQNYYVPGTNYPVHTHRYNPAYPYQVNSYNAQSNTKSENVLRIRDKEAIDNQYLQNILNYLISSNLMVELKRKYAAAGNGADLDALRSAYIVGHLQNLGIYHKLSREQLQYLTQQLQQNEMVAQKDVTHKIEIIYDTNDDKVASNQNIDPKQYYVIPYASLNNGGATNFDENTVNNAVGELGARVFNIVTYLRKLRVPNAMIVQFIAEAKKHLTNEDLQGFAMECQNKAYVQMGERIDMLAKQVLQRCMTCPRYVTPYNY